MTNNLKVYSPEWDALEMLLVLKTPDENAPLRVHREYWQKLRSIATLAANAAMLAAIECGKVEERENRKEQSNGAN